MAHPRNTIQTISERLQLTASGCLEWTGGKRYGYGQCSVGGESWSVHRLIYTYYRGPVPDDLVIDHLCRNRACANVDHLQAVSQKVNFNRAPNGFSSRTHCPAGHAYEGDNVIRHGPGKRKRRCRICHNAGVNARWRRRQEAAGRDIGVYTKNRTHCPQGHPYDEANTWYSPVGWRGCRACNRERHRNKANRDPSNP